MSKIPDTITVEFGGTSREVFMSFGLLNEMVTYIGDIERISTIMIDPKMRIDLLNMVFAERDENGVITKNLNAYGIKLSPAQVQDVFQWISEHVLDFFLTAIQRTLAVHAANQDRLTASMLSGNGSAPSA